MKCLSNEEKKLFCDFVNTNIVKYNYFDKSIFFIDQKKPLYTYYKGKTYGPWVSWTGLTTKRPIKIISFLQKNNFITSTDTILDVGCGLSEMGLEIERRNIGCRYVGIDINPLLLKINTLNLQNYKFYQYDLLSQKEKNFLDDKYNIVMMMGAESHHEKFAEIINNKIKPKYVICETHINRNNDLENIIKKLKKYNIVCKHNFKFINKINKYHYEPIYNRIMYILKIQ